MNTDEIIKRIVAAVDEELAGMTRDDTIEILEEVATVIQDKADELTGMGYASDSEEDE